MNRCRGLGQRRARSRKGDSPRTQCIHRVENSACAEIESVIVRSRQQTHAKLLQKIDHLWLSGMHRGGISRGATGARATDHDLEIRKTDIEFAQGCGQWIEITPRTLTKIVGHQALTQKTHAGGALRRTRSDPTTRAGQQREREDATPRNQATRECERLAIHVPDVEAATPADRFGRSAIAARPTANKVLVMALKIGYSCG